MLLTTVISNAQTTKQPINLKVTDKLLRIYHGKRQFGFVAAIKNSSTKTVNAFKGVLKVNDVLGDELISVKVMDDEGVKPGATDTATFWYDYTGTNYNQEKVVRSPIEKLKFEWQPLAAN